MSRRPSDTSRRPSGTGRRPGTVSRRRYDWPLALAVLAVGIATRLAARYRSPLPYNTDGFVYVSSAERILADDAVTLSGSAAPAPDEYLFSTLLATVSEFVGVEPLYLAQVVVAVLAAVPSLIVANYVRSLTAELPRHYSRAAAAFAGIGLAVQGPYLFRTMSVHAEVFGLAILACLVLGVHRALRTGECRWIGLSVALGVPLPFVHNLSAVIAGLVVTTLVALDVARRPGLRRLAAGTLGVLGFWLLTVGYYEAVDLPKAGAVTASLGLFLAWVVLLVGIARWLDTASSTVQQAVPLAVFGCCTLVFVANATTSLFPGTATSSTLLLALSLPLAAPLVLAIHGLPRLASERGLGMFAFALGPLAAIGFALTAGRTPAHHDLLLRSSTFLHPGLLVAAAVGLAWLAHRRPAIGRAAAAIAVVALLVTAPLPFAGLQAFPFEPVTEPDEFDAATFATERVEAGWATDDHLALVSDNYRQSEATDVPTIAWLRGDAPPPGCPTLARRSWTTVGAPAMQEPLKISHAAYERWVVTGDVVYAGGSDGAGSVDDEIVLRWEPESCRGAAVAGSR